MFAISGKQCKVRGKCADMPCQNDAECLQTPDGMDYSCLCTRGKFMLSC